MAEIALPEVVTAVPDASTEGFIAGTLFGQGWNVVFRALDSSSLKSYLESAKDSLRDVVLIYSPDLPGLKPSEIASYNANLRQVVGFSDKPFPDFFGLLPIPANETELLNCVRGSVRAPMIRNQPPDSFRKRASVVAIASPAGATGCTTIAINLAMEMSMLGKKTLLIDGDVRSPSIAPLLGLHNLEQEPLAREVAANLYLAEFGRAKMAKLSDFIQNALQNFDCVFMDLGSIEEISDALTDRRWSSTLVHWTCENADEIIFVGKSDPLSLYRFESLVENLKDLTISSHISFLLNMQAPGRKRSLQDSRFFEVCSSIRHHRLLCAPRDASIVVKAQNEKATLVEVSDRSRLRKALAKMAVELQP